MRKGMMTALAMLAAGIVYGFTPQAHTNRVVRDGVTYVQRGALGAGDYVVTNVDVASFVSGVASVNGKTGTVVLVASDVGALADNEEALVANTNFQAAVEAVSPPVVLPQNWALANVTNAAGTAVKAADVLAIGTDTVYNVDTGWGLRVYGADTPFIDWNQNGDMRWRGKLDWNAIGYPSAADVGALSTSGGGTENGASYTINSATRYGNFGGATVISGDAISVNEFLNPTSPTKKPYSRISPWYLDLCTWVRGSGPRSYLQTTRYGKNDIKTITTSQSTTTTNTISIPSSSGTIALTSQLSDYIPTDGDMCNIHYRHFEVAGALWCETNYAGALQHMPWYYTRRSNDPNDEDEIATIGNISAATSSLRSKADLNVYALSPRITITTNATIRNTQYVRTNEVYDIIGRIATEGAESLSSMLFDVHTNQSCTTEKCLVMTNIVRLVGNEITNTVNAVKAQYWDEPLAVNWTIGISNGDMTFSATTNVNQSVLN